MAEGSEVASVAVVSEGRLLMGLRRDDFRWTLPGGHLEPGEDPLKGAIRELAEETGIVAADLIHLGSEDIITFTGQNKRIHAYRLDNPPGAYTNADDPDHEVYHWEWIPISDGLPDHVAKNLHSSKNVVLRAMGLLSFS